MNELRMQLRGGLGNQLFQIAAMNFFSRKLPAKVVLDDVAIIRHKDETRRSWSRELDIQSMFNNPNLNWTNRRLTIFRSQFANANAKFETLDEEEVLLLNSLSKNYRIVGWFQSSRYLPQRKIRLETILINGISKRTMDYGEECKNSARGAVHIRLGDFKQTSWGILNPSWYQKAVEVLIKSGVSQIDCFSDDVREAKSILQVFNGKINYTFPEEKEIRSPIELLWLLSSYRSIVSSNSSLSWWASYLNQNLNPLIVCHWERNLIMPGWVPLGLNT